MIHLRFEIRNPWSKDRFKNLGRIGGQISKNKAWELEHSFYDAVIFNIECKFTTKQDHAGLELVLGFLGHEVHFMIYDRRHWDFETNKWKEHD